MNHHARSYSEQPQAASMTLGNQPQSFIRIHSDSQQSLDQLFNPTYQASVPLRNRNLPQSFFNPGAKLTADQTNGTSDRNATNGITMNNGNSNSNASSLHTRSISFDQNQQVPNNRLANQRMNLHTRTHSTIAPMPRLISNHSSQDFLNASPVQEEANNVAANNVSNLNNNNINLHQSYHRNHHNHSHHHNNNNNNHNHHPITNGWSSNANSMDDLPASPLWVPGQVVTSQSVATQPNLQHHQQQQQQQQQQVQLSGPHQQPVLSEPASMQQATHQHTVFYNANSLPTPDVASVQVMSNNFHTRSISFNQRPDNQANHGFHMRTHSTIAPMSGPCNLLPAASHLSSHRSSQDFLNQSSATNASGSTGWSSSGYSTDDMTTNGHCWTAGGPPQPAVTQAPISTGTLVGSQGTTTLHQQQVQPVATPQHQEQQSQQVFYQI